MDTDGYANSSEDLAHLQRLLRITEGDCRAYYRDTKLTLLKQRKIIHKLEAEQAEILSKVDDDRWSAFARPDDQYVATLFNVYKEVKLELQKERHDVQKQKAEILNLEKNIAKLLVKKKRFVQQSQPNSGARRLEVLEGRIETASAHYNKLLCNNGHLRGTIEHLLQWRTVHRHIVKDLSRTLSVCKHQIEGLINAAVENYNAREEYHEKLLGLKGDHAVDSRQCRLQLQEAKRLLQMQKQLVEFVARKNKKRVGGEGALLSAGLRRESRFLRELGQHAVPGEDCGDGRSELFTYASSLNHKVEQLQSDILQLKNDRRIFELESESVKERNVVVKHDLEAEITALKQQCVQSEHELSSLKKVLQKLKSGIDGMLQLVSGNVTVPDCDDNDVSKPAVMRAMKDIECQVNELLQARKFLEDQQNKVIAAMNSSTITKRASSVLGHSRSVSSLRHAADIAFLPPTLQWEAGQEAQAESSKFYPRAHLQEEFVRTSSTSPVSTLDAAQHCTPCRSSTEVVHAAFH